MREDNRSVRNSVTIAEATIASWLRREHLSVLRIEKVEAGAAQSIPRLVYLQDDERAKNLLRRSADARLPVTHLSEITAGVAFTRPTVESAGAMFAG